MQKWLGDNQSVVKTEWCDNYKNYMNAGNVDESEH